MLRDTRPLLLCGLVVLAACEDSVPVTEPPAGMPRPGLNPAAPTAASLGQNRVWPQEQPFEEISAAVPEFGGFFLEGSTVVAYVTDARLGTAVRRLVQAALAGWRQHPQDPVPEIVIRGAQYSFRQLRDWRDLVTAEILPLEDAVSVDLDEGRNRVHIGLETGRSRPEVEARLAALGIPLPAVVFGVPGRIVKEDKLTDRRRPVMGGIQIDPASTGACTFGYNAIRQQFPPSSVFLTAAHCSAVRWGNDGDAIFQPLQTDAADRIGREVHDPLPFRCGPPWDRGDCRYSDATIILHETSSFEQGFIARTVDRVGPGRGLRGSLDIDGNNPRLEIIGSSSTFLQGQRVDKIGRTTGWTFGDVMHTCRHVEDGDVVTLCQEWATYSSEGGDSGSPVFIWNGDNTVQLHGIHWASHTGENLALFSPLSGVSRDLGSNLIVVRAVAAEIQGPSVVTEQGTYDWEAFPAGGNGTYSYQWYVHYFSPDQTVTLGTAKTQSLDVAQSDGHFEMLVTVSSAGLSLTDAHFVNNNINLCTGCPERPTRSDR